MLEALLAEAATGGVLLKKLFLKISPISHVTPVLERLFNRVAGVQVQLY